MGGYSTSGTINFTFQTDLQVLIFSLSKCKLLTQRLHAFPSWMRIDLSHEAIKPIASIFFVDEADLLHEQTAWYQFLSQRPLCVIVYSTTHDET